MARRYDHNRDEVKEMAIVAGRKIIAEQGFNTLTTRKIAKEIGYTVGTLYNIFENFDDLILHLNAVTLEEMYTFITHRLEEDNPASPAAGIKTMAQGYIDFAIENPNFWAGLYEHILPPDYEIPEWYFAKLAPLFGTIEEVLTPLCNDEERNIAANVLWAGLHGICTLGMSNKLALGGNTDMETLAMSFIDNYMSGLKLKLNDESSA